MLQFRVDVRYPLSWRVYSYPDISGISVRVLSKHLAPFQHHRFDPKICSMWTGKRRNPRVQFLPRLPLNDIAGWVRLRETRVPSVPAGEPFASQSRPHRTPGHPVAQADSNPKRRRQDFPLVRTRDPRPSNADVDLCPDQMRSAWNDLCSDMYASSSRAPRDARLKTWIKFHQKWFGDEVGVLPITEDKLVKVSSLFKRGGYKCVKNYTSHVSKNIT